jgi:ABC-type transport system involved in multi-copper enzyme maturation permease subunit
MTTTGSEAHARSAVWTMRLAQLRVIVQREWARQAFRWRGAWIYPLAFGPLLIITVHSVYDRHSICRLENESAIWAGIFQYYYVRVGIFFGTAVLFARSFRGEILDRSLHYLLLLPLRRELLLVGKFLGALVASVMVFELAVIACYLTMFGHFAEGRAFLGTTAALTQLGGYVLATAMACVGFGAVFLAIGLLFRNPVIPSVTVLGLETWSVVLPPWLQRLTITFYLKALCPVPAPVEGWTALLTIVVEPTPTWLAVSGLLVVAAVVLAFAARYVRRLEINYTTD